MNKLIILLCLFCSIGVFAQKGQVVTVKNIRGEFSMTDEMIESGGYNPKEKARDDARRKAIEQVCGQHIQIWDKLETSAAGESFNSLAILQTDGEVVQFDVLNEGKETSKIRSSEIIYYCEANVKVRKGVSPDPNFTAKINGVRSVYFKEEILSFSVQPLIDCYLTIFLLENVEIGYKLYPVGNDNSILLKSNYCERFPLENEWFITKESNNPKEINHLMFVFTKKNLKFPNDETSRAEIEKWVMIIPADQRFVDIETIEIREK